MSTFIIRNGSICIGDGSSCFNGDILVADGIIRSVRQGRITAEGAEVIDASGLIVSPGFIDMHSHSDLTLLANPQGESKLSQGVTTEVVGNCGLTAFPVSDCERRKSLLCPAGESISSEYGAICRAWWNPGCCDGV